MASISEAEIYFSEIEIRNAYNTMDNITWILAKHYMNQGAE